MAGNLQHSCNMKVKGALVRGYKCDAGHVGPVRLSRERVG